MAGGILVLVLELHALGCFDMHAITKPVAPFAYRHQSDLKKQFLIHYHTTTYTEQDNSANEQQNTKCPVVSTIHNMHVG